MISTFAVTSLFLNEQYVRMSCIQINFSFMAHQPLAGQGLLTVEASRSHSDTPHSVGFLWTNNQTVAETYT
jgi:hypothetical protein